MAVGRQQARAAETQVYEIEAKPYLLAKVGLADTPGATCRVVLTTSGDRSLDKLTLRTSHDGHDDGVEIKAGDAQEISFWPGSERDDLDAYIYIRVRPPKLFEALSDMGPEPISSSSCLSILTVAGTRELTCLCDSTRRKIRHHRSLQSLEPDGCLEGGPNDTRRTIVPLGSRGMAQQEENICCSSEVRCTPASSQAKRSSIKSQVLRSQMKANIMMEVYSNIAVTMRELERGRPGKSTKGKAKNAPDPKQTKLR